MSIKNCEKCGGDHAGSNKCPFPDDLAAEYKAALARNEETKKLPVDVWADRLARDLSKFTD